MALDFSRYLDVPVEDITPPKSLPLGHYFADIKGWKGAERDYDKSTGGPKTPVVEITFSITGADDDVDPTELPDGGGVGRMVAKDYTLNDDGMGQSMLRRLGEDTCGLAVKGLHLSDLLDALKGQSVRIFNEPRPGKEEGQFYPSIKKVLPIS